MINLNQVPITVLDAVKEREQDQEKQVSSLLNYQGKVEVIYMQRHLKKVQNAHLVILI
jgi:hypothetical protein